MPEVLCPGISMTEGLKEFFARFHTRPTGQPFREVLDEQLAVVERRVRETETRTSSLTRPATRSSSVPCATGGVPWGRTTA
eukprot:1821718-Alexandrium_andersonii.AAC.1